MPSYWIRRRLLARGNISSCSRLQADLQEPKAGEPSLTRPLENQYSEEFARFKAAVDKDPFTAVFGRRLESPRSSSNLSWTSFLKGFESVPAEEARSTAGTPTTEPLSTVGNVKADSSKEGSPKTTTKESGLISSQVSSATGSTGPGEEAEYEFDPISMKKVLKKKKKQEAQPRKETENRPFLSTLFAEHGVDVPVKTYKPHKVYGYPVKDEPRSPSDKNGGTPSPQAGQQKFESSRLQELQKLKAFTLGNGVDATNFCGKYQVKGEDAKPVACHTEPKAVSENATDDAPLFSGTTYEAKSYKTVGTKAEARRDWLAEEGFRTSSLTSDRRPSGLDAAASPEKQTSAEEPVSRIEPALDRMSVADARSPPTRSKLKQPTAGYDKDKDKAKDLDLLRPSDVRAQVSSARRTKYETDLNQNKAQQRLETDYISRQRRSDQSDENAEDPIAISPKRIQDGLSSLWKRVQNQPQYANLANTIKNMGGFQDAWKKYSRHGIIENPNEKLVFKDQSLSKTPSIYRQTANRPDRTIDTFTPSKEVLEAERESQARTAALRAANENAKREEAELKRRDTELASEIRKAYESQYGPIDVHHRQLGSTAESAADAAESPPTTVAEPAQQQLPELQSASSSVRGNSPAAATDVEKDVEANTAQHYSKTLQPRIDRLVEEVRNTRKVLHEVSLHVKAIKSRRPPTYWNTSATEPFSDPTDPPIARNPSKTPKSTDAFSSASNSPREDAAGDIAAYTAAVVAANQSAAKAPALEKIRERHTHQVEHQEPWVQPLVPRMQESSDAATGTPQYSSAEYINQIQATEKAAVEAAAETFHQPKANESRDSPTEGEVAAIEAQPVASLNTPLPPVDTASLIQQSPGLYKILAYDSSSLQVSIATTTSSLSASASGSGDVDSPLHPTEVLSRLNNPAKFLPYFQGLQEEGYEIVSGSGDILVFKRVRETSESSATAGAPQVATAAGQQADTSVQKEAATVREEIPSKPTPPPPPPLSSPKVRRKEDVFSGSGKTWLEKETQPPSSSDNEKPSEGAWSRIKRGLQRVLLTGLATAAVAYAIGAVAESFGAEQQPLCERGQVKRTGTRPGIYSTESSR